MKLASTSPFGVLFCAVSVLGCGASHSPASDAGDGSVLDLGADASAAICGECTDDDDCDPSMRCALVGSSRRCVVACDELAPICPATFRCGNPFDPVLQETVCLPRGPACCIDADGDGFGIGLGCLGSDCNDASASVHPPPRAGEICGNGIDDDCNGETDEDVDESCDDGGDNDCDGLADCADDDCDGEECAANGDVCVLGMCGCDASETACGDGRDEDCDGDTDCDDDDCDDAACGANGRVCIALACVCPGNVTAEGGGASCGDGADNDCDGSIDCEDSDCEGRICGLNSRRCTAAGACGCVDIQGGDGTAESSCSDGYDNDCDGRIDCQDPECNGRACDGGQCFGTSCQ